jgi:hypothetical protein
MVSFFFLLTIASHNRDKERETEGQEKNKTYWFTVTFSIKYKINKD